MSRSDEWVYRMLREYVDEMDEQPEAHMCAHQGRREAMPANYLQG